jgi:hypothetical protein
MKHLIAVFLLLTAIAEGSLLGPRMIIAGPMLDGPVPRFPSSAPIANADDARRTVDDLQSQGVDFIKIQSLIPRDGYFAAADEAKKRGIVFVGHVPDAVRASEASDAGQKSIEHFTGIFEGCSTIEDQLIKGPKSLGQNVATFDPARAQMTLAMFRAGVPFMAGTDTAAGVHIFPGFSLHEELALFVRAGLTPLQALQTATRNPAEFMGRLSDMGTVEQGKLADLVLLDANPLDDIANTRKIRAVVLAGRYFGRDDLDRMLEGVKRAAAEPDSAAAHPAGST